MATIRIKQGDLRPIITATLVDSTDTAIDLTSASSVKFVMNLQGSTTNKIDAAGVILTAASGIVTYTWVGTDTDTIGTYDAEFEVKWATDIYQTFPVRNYLTVEIVQDLGGDV